MATRTTSVGPSASNSRTQGPLGGALSGTAVQLGTRNQQGPYIRVAELGDTTQPTFSPDEGAVGQGSTMQIGVDRI